AVPSDGRDDTVRADPTDAMIVSIRDKDAAVRGHRHRKWLGQHRLSRWAIVTAEARRAIPSDRRDDAVGPDPTDALIGNVRDVHTAIRTHGDSVKTIERCVCRRASVAA